MKEGQNVFSEKAKERDALFLKREAEAALFLKREAEAALSLKKDMEAAAGYEYEGRRIRIHFSGEKSLMQCMKNLTENYAQNKAGC